VKALTIREFLFLKIDIDGDPVGDPVVCVNVRREIKVFHIDILDVLLITAQQRRGGT